MTTVNTLDTTNGVHGTFAVAPWVAKALSQTGKGRKGNGFGQREACGRGHLYSDGQWVLAKDGSRRCVACTHVARAKRESSRPTQELSDRRERDVLYNKEWRKAKRAGMSMSEWRIKFGDTIAKKNPLAYLAMSGDMAYASDTLNDKVDELGRPRCESNPDAYADVDESVSTVDAKNMCRGCPLMGTGSCLAYGKLIVPNEGRWVFEGKLFIDGKIQK